MAFERLSASEIETLGLTNVRTGTPPKVGSRFRDVDSGEILTRRQVEDIRVREIGWPNYGSYQRANYDENYNIFRRMRSTKRGGIDVDSLRSLKPGSEGRRFNETYARARFRGQPRDFRRLYRELDIPAGDDRAMRRITRIIRNQSR